MTVETLSACNEGSERANNPGDRCWRCRQVAHTKRREAEREGLPLREWYEY